jgi:glycosyltransferase involved in cell wall biosynthesis
MTAPSISVVIPSFNQGPYLERTLLSILRQEYPGRVQVIVSDGGSTDGTVEILRRYPHVTWWSEKDRGIAHATNKALACADGELLAIQSSDDFYLRDAFRRTAGAFAADSGLSIVSGCDVYLQPDGATFSCSRLDEHEVDPRSLLLRRVFPQHCTFFRRGVLDVAGMLRKTQAEGAEIDFWYRALHRVRGRFIPWHTAVYQLHAGQRTQTGARRWYRSLTGMVEDAENDPVLGALYRMSDADRFNLYARWQIQAAAISGREADARWLAELTLRDERFTQETRDWLALHGHLPRVQQRGSASRHPNHRVPDLTWWRAPARAAA